MSKIVTIDGIEYIEIADTELPFGNVCRSCAFYNTNCYDRNDFTCHPDARPDGIGVFFVLAKQSLDACVGDQQKHKDAQTNKIKGG